MDRCNNQYNGSPQRPQMPPPPCMNAGYDRPFPPSPMNTMNMTSPRVSSGRDCLSDMPIGMSYVPIQNWMQTYPIEQGLHRGTIFPELDYPFTMRRCSR